LFAGLLTVSMHPERPATGHLDTGFLGFPLSLSKLFPNSKLLLHASHTALPILNSSKLPPVVDADDLIVSQIIDKTI
jgi:hypothetical protein